MTVIVQGYTVLTIFLIDFVPKMQYLSYSKKSIILQYVYFGPNIYQRQLSRDARDK